jgi:hypothetical protein
LTRPLPLACEQLDLVGQFANAEDSRANRPRGLTPGRPARIVYQPTQAPAFLIERDKLDKRSRRRLAQN